MNFPINIRFYFYRRHILNLPIKIVIPEKNHYRKAQGKTQISPPRLIFQVLHNNEDLSCGLITLMDSWNN